MGIESYERLLRQVAKQLAVDEQLMIERQQAEVKGKLLRFDFLPRLDLCRVSMDLDPPPGDPLEIMGDMLAANCQPGDEVLTVMALNPESGHPVIHFHLPLDGHLEEAMCFFLAQGLEVFQSEWQAMAQAQRQESAAHSELFA